MSENKDAATSGQLDYASTGVDTAAGDRAVDLMEQAVLRTHNTTVFGGTGGFAGMVDAVDLLGMKHPLLATSTDGVGTKIAIARAMGIHDTIGQDLVAMVVDDIVVVGAKPLFMTDYIACGKVIPERIASIVTGVARACEQIDCPLVGGETAEHPGLMAPDDYDIAGAATGVVDADKALDPSRVKNSDVIIGIASSGLHSNGYSLVRRVVELSASDLGAHVDDFGRTLGEELLEPTRLYTRVCLDLIAKLGVGEDGVHAFSHVTGGGLGANLARVLPAGFSAEVNRSSWVIPPVFDWVRRMGDVSWEALEESLNLGIGMVALVAPSSVGAARTLLSGFGMETSILGTVASDNSMAPPVGAAVRTVSGTKGVKGGTVYLSGEYRLS